MKNHGFLIESDLFWNGIEGSTERSSLEAWIKLCREAHTILDVGANTGMFSLVAKCINPGADVYAFDPIPRNYEKLVENCHLNRYDVHCECMALGKYDGEGVMYDTPFECVYSVALDKKLDWVESGTIEIRVQVNRLDSYAAAKKLSEIDVMKIDVETGEPDVLSGMGELLKKNKPSMLIEVLNDEVAAACEKQLKGLGYIYFSIDEERGLVPVARMSKSHGYNYLVCLPAVAERYEFPRHEGTMQA